MTRLQYGVNLAIFPFVLVLIGFMAMGWLIQDLWNGTSAHD